MTWVLWLAVVEVAACGGQAIDVGKTSGFAAQATTAASASMGASAGSAASSSGSAPQATSGSLRTGGTSGSVSSAGAASGSVSSTGAASGTVSSNGSGSGIGGPGDDLLPKAYTLTQSRNMASPIPNPVGVTFDGQELWILNQGSQLVRFNPDQFSVDRMLTPPLPSSPGTCTPFGITWDGAAIWVTVAGVQDNALVRIDATDGKITQMMSSPTNLGPSDLDFDGLQLWLSTGTGDVYRIDPVSGGITEHFPTARQSGGRDNGIAYSMGEVWIGDLFGSIEVHDAATGAAVGRAVHADGSDFTQDEVGPSCFVNGQLVMVSTLGITYYDVAKLP